MPLEVTGETAVAADPAKGALGDLALRQQARAYRYGGGKVVSPALRLPQPTR